MPPITKIKKEDIIDESYRMLREYGFEGLNARKIAKNLNCSIQPIFHNFKNMEELKTEVLKKVISVYHTYMKQNLDTELPYKQIGINYINFAKEEPELFKIMFMSHYNIPASKLISDDPIYEEVKKYIGEQLNLSADNIKNFHVKMWIFTHGIATMLATKTCDFTSKQISDLLTCEFKALKLLEKEK